MNTEGASRNDRQFIHREAVYMNSCYIHHEIADGPNGIKLLTEHLNRLPEKGTEPENPGFPTGS